MAKDGAAIHEKCDVDKDIFTHECMYALFVHTCVQIGTVDQ